ncbi:hypothetical protein BLOT_010611 [Blomia tropicalis]|nr:hypothetical protein BLOT_010611 [Blomia tropicalis]
MVPTTTITNLFTHDYTPQTLVIGIIFLFIQIVLIAFWITIRRWIKSAAERRILLITTLDRASSNRSKDKFSNSKISDLFTPSGAGGTDPKVGLSSASKAQISAKSSKHSTADIKIVSQALNNQETKQFVASQSRLTNSPIQGPVSNQI